MKKKRLIILFGIIILSNNFLNSQNLPLNNKNIRKINNLKLIDVSLLTQMQLKVYDELKDIKPNFLTDFVFSLDVTVGSEDLLLSEIKLLLSNYNLFSEIPYYSKRNKTWHNLFEDISHRSNTKDRLENYIYLRMSPFEPGLVKFTIENESKGFLFHSINIDPLKYRFIQASRSGMMKISISVEKTPGKIYVYGLGGAKAYKGISSSTKERIDTAINGRIEAFFLWIMSSVKELELYKEICLDNKYM